MLVTGTHKRHPSSRISSSDIHKNVVVKYGNCREADPICQEKGTAIVIKGYNTKPKVGDIIFYKHSPYQTISGVIFADFVERVSQDAKIIDYTEPNKENEVGFGDYLILIKNKNDQYIMRFLGELGENDVGDFSFSRHPGYKTVHIYRLLGPEISFDAVLGYLEQEKIEYEVIEEYKDPKDVTLSIVDSRDKNLESVIQNFLCGRVVLKQSPIETVSLFGI